ncbi:MAG: hypothetical protein RLY14_3521 [Planctomycetota bacterium]|jgi:hypothetical protein
MSQSGIGDRAQRSGADARLVFGEFRQFEGVDSRCAIEQITTKGVYSSRWLRHPTLNVCESK